jgi:hypothetical protein
MRPQQIDQGLVVLLLPIEQSQFHLQSSTWFCAVDGDGTCQEKMLVSR